MSKGNGRIKDYEKGGGGARVVNGALQVRVSGGGGVTFPITPAQGGTGTTTLFTKGRVVVADNNGVYQQDQNFFWDRSNSALLIYVTGGLSQVVIGKWGGSSSYGSIGLAGSVTNVNFNFASSSVDTNLYINRPSAKDIRFWHNGIEQARLNNSGRLLLGTTSDDGSNLLQVNGGIKGLNWGTAVTGSRALPEQALKDLLTKLAAIGVITDSTTI